jgi:hypothetical protein
MTTDLKELLKIYRYSSPSTTEADGQVTSLSALADVKRHVRQNRVSRGELASCIQAVFHDHPSFKRTELINYCFH